MMTVLREDRITTRGLFQSEHDHMITKAMAADTWFSIRDRRIPGCKTSRPTRRCQHFKGHCIRTRRLARQYGTRIIQSLALHTHYIYQYCEMATTCDFSQSYATNEQSPNGAEAPLSKYFAHAIIQGLALCCIARRTAAAGSSARLSCGFDGPVIDWDSCRRSMIPEDLSTTTGKELQRKRFPPLGGPFDGSV
ncbi:hypothetical protein DAEQUDRAFT_347295 [Daedalea quercina L-15889]|uniref:Uncharacterized protein n=1 Tax=Daedalea quercina L-15889 TaxID=1314783 RepID=A0A165PCM2_9APHY|nr:hypothetical protein DAEQUDRAFT_347295 [Daedalea quercina L-15889]